MSDAQTIAINNIIVSFYNALFKIIKICKKVEPNMLELDDVHRRVSLARDIDPLIVIDRCKDKIWMYKDQIIDEDEEFFLNNKFSNFIKNDENKSLIYNILNLIKDRYREMSVPEKKAVWKIIQDLLKLIIEYKKATGDYVI